MKGFEDLKAFGPALARVADAAEVVVEGLRQFSESIRRLTELGRKRKDRAAK